ncbi:uncharacterized protein LOC142598229 [Dermatophagoides farinae]|uniref:uncharacterized protein LOC142598229 n=1 Tax=Dermatophagoides farinae TaxID=6954 RepID=UPI003F61D62C
MYANHIEPQLLLVTIFFLVTTFTLQIGYILIQLHFCFEIIALKFNDRYNNNNNKLKSRQENPVCLHNQQCLLIEHKLWIISSEKNDGINNRIRSKLIKLKIVFFDIIFEIFKLFLQFTALKCITFQWKITSLIIYLIFFGFFQLSTLFNQDILYKFQKHLINSIQYHDRLYGHFKSKFWQTFIIKCNLGLFWIICLTNLITYILIWWCFCNYLSNTMPELISQFMD